MVIHYSGYIPRCGTWRQIAWCPIRGLTRPTRPLSVPCLLLLLRRRRRRVPRCWRHTRSRFQRSPPLPPLPLASVPVPCHLALLQPRQPLQPRAGFEIASCALCQLCIYVMCVCECVSVCVCVCVYVCLYVYT